MDVRGGGRVEEFAAPGAGKRGRGSEVVVV
jgi:hypothetical protein